MLAAAESRAGESGPDTHTRTYRWPRALLDGGERRAVLRQDTREDKRSQVQEASMEWKPFLPLLKPGRYATAFL